MDFETIAFFNVVFPYGGADIVTSNLSKFFFKRGIKIVLYTQRIDYEKLTDEDKKIFIFRELPGGEQDVFSDANRDYIISSIKNDKVQCLIIQGIVKSFPFQEIKNQTNCKILFCCHSKPLHEIDILKLRKLRNLPNPTFARKLEWLLIRKPIYNLSNKLEKRFMSQYCKILQHVDKMIFLCTEYEKEFHALLNNKKYCDNNCYDQKLYTINNPLLPQNGVEFDNLIKDNTILYVGRLTCEDKRVDRLIEIWKRVEKQNPEWKLKIIGTGEEEGNLKKLAKKLELKNIEFLGYKKNVTDYYRSASFVCLTSNFEGWGLCFTEGQQYGSIPISFDSFAAIRTITQNGECGVMIPSYSKKIYAETLNNLLKDRIKQREMGVKCIEASKRYDLDIIGEQWIRLFNSL